MKRNKSWLPTRKWFAALVVALTGWAVAFVNVHGTFTDTIVISLITIVSQAAIAYLVPNQGTPGGVPVTVSKRGKK